MKSTPLEKKVQTIVNDILEKNAKPVTVKNVDANLLANDLIDSLAFVELIFRIEDEFKITSRDHQFNRKHFETIKNICSLISPSLREVPLTKSSFGRVTKLLNNSKLFNVNPPGLSEAELKNYSKNKNFKLFAFSIDNLPEEEIIAFVMINLHPVLNVEKFVLSDKALERNIEFEIIDFITQKTTGHSLNFTATFNESNIAAQSFLKKIRAIEINPGIYAVELDEQRKHKKVS